MMETTDECGGGALPLETQRRGSVARAAHGPMPERFREDRNFPATNRTESSATQNGVLLASKIADHRGHNGTTKVRRTTTMVTATTKT